MTVIADIVRRLICCAKATASIEAAIVLPVAISLMVGSVEFGRIMSGYATADKSMRAAARYLARTPEMAVCSWGQDNAINMAVYGSMYADGSEPLLPGWQPAHVTVETSHECGFFQPDTTITIRSAVPFSVFMLDAIGLPNEWTLNVTHQERHIGS